VKRARGLNVKGKNGTNDAFVTIGLGKEKFQTSVKEKSEEPEWCEQCELSIPEQGNRAQVVLKVLHRNFMGGDDFLGQVSLPLQDFDVYEKPKAGWYTLQCKPGQNKTGYRGELEVKIGFTVRACDSVGGSTADLAKKNKGSMSSLNKVAGNIGGSLLSLGGKEKKNFKKIAASVSSKVEKAGSKAKKSVSSLKLNKDKDRGGLDSLPETEQWNRVMFDNAGTGFQNEDPGVNSDEEDDMFQFDTLSHQSSHSSLATSKLGTVSAVSTPLQGSMESLSIQHGKRSAGVGDWEAKLLGYKNGLHVPPSHEDTVSMTSILSSASQATTLDTWTPYHKQDTGTPYSRQTSGTLPRQNNRTDRQRWSGENEEEDRKVWATNNKEEKKEAREEKNASLSSLPSYNEVMGKEKERNEKKLLDKERKNTKKKIIPVVSDSSESSPSPEDPSSPADSPHSSSLSSRMRSFQQSSLRQHDVENIKNKFNNSLSFRERRESKAHKKAERPATNLQHSLTFSSGREGPPHGTRVVLGRETSPVPVQTHTRIPQEIRDKFAGMTREDLIEMVVKLQGQVEEQGRRVGDMEEYIDSLLVKIMENTPVLLEKNIMSCKPCV